MIAGTVMVTRHDGNGTWLVALRGEHDISTTQLLDRETGGVWAGCTPVVVNLSDVTFIDCSVIHWLLGSRDCSSATAAATCRPQHPLGRTPRWSSERRRARHSSRASGVLEAAQIRRAVRTPANVSAPATSAFVRASLRLLRSTAAMASIVAAWAPSTAASARIQLRERWRSTTAASTKCLKPRRRANTRTALSRRSPRWLTSVPGNPSSTAP